ncbi:MAG: hypothetical protein JNK73_05810 [Bacteroidia bacterium]|nr:hypothetical protein [Bacteroidia bacterium]
MSDKIINWQKRRFWHLVGGIVLFLTGTYFYFNVQRSDSDILSKDLEIVDSLVLSDKPIIKQNGGRAKMNYFEFKCVGFNKSFDIDIYHYSCSDINSIMALKTGDTISIKLIKSDILSIDFETFNSQSNQVHSLVYKSQDYLDLNCRNKKVKDDNKFGYYICFIMAPLTLFFSLFKNKPTFIGSIEPVLILCAIGLLVMLILKADIFQ